MDILSNATKTIGGLLSDPAKEQMATASDRVGGNLSTNASSASQATTKKKYGFFPAKDNHDHFFSHSTKRNTANTNPLKLVELGSANWAETGPSLEEMLSIPLPQGFYSSNKKPAHGPTRPWASIRVSFDFELQVNSVTGSCGSLMLVYFPPGVELTRCNLRTLRLLPNVEVNIGSDTTGKLHVPYTHYQNYVTVDSSDLGSVKVFIWCPLTVPADTPGTVSATVYGALDQMDLQCPRAQGPERVRRDIAEGVGAMNLANSQHTRRTMSVALNGESVAADPTTSGSSRAVRSVKDLLQVYAPVLADLNTMTTPWNVSATKGTALISANLAPDFMNNISQFFCNGYCYYRGSISLRLTVFNSTLHKGRLRFAYFPNPGVTSTPDYTAEQSDNAFYKILDIGLNPSVEMVIPFTSDTWLRPVRATIGRLKVFVASRLSASTNCAPNVRILVEARFCEDLEMCCPRDGGINFQSGDDDDDDYTSWGSQVERAEANGELDVQDGTLEASTSAAAAAAGVSANSQEQDKPGSGPTAKPAKFVNAIIKDIKVAKADHMLTQVIFGRAQLMGILSRDASAFFTFDLVTPESGFFSFLKAFAYWNGDLNVHILNESVGHTQVAHTYQKSFIPATPNGTTLSTFGAVVIPPNQAVSMTVPFYFYRPARLTTQSDALGTLIIKSEASMKLTVWLSFKTISLFQPIPIPKKATLRTYLRQNWDSEREHPDQEALEALAAKGLWDEPLEDLHRHRTRNFYGPNLAMYGALVKEEVGDNVTTEDWIRDLTAEGIESNPGPKCHLVYLNRGLYKHYGVRFGPDVIHMDSEDILRAAATGKVIMTRTPYHDAWITEKELDIESFRAEALTEMVGREVLFSGRNNCETVAKEALNLEGITQAQALAYFGIIICSVTSASLAGVAASQAGGGDFIKKVKESATSAWTSVTSFFSEELLNGIECTVVRTVMKMVVRIVCYGILFCSSPNLLTGAAVATLVAMDLTTVDGLTACVKDLCSALLDGDLVRCASAMTEIVHKNSSNRKDMVKESIAQVKYIIKDLEEECSITSEGDPIKLFNNGTTAAKNFEWWMALLQRFFKWLKRFFSLDRGTETADWLCNHTELVADVLANGDQMIVEAREIENTRSSEWQKSLDICIKEMTALKHLALAAQCTDVLNQTNNMLTKLTKIPKPQACSDDVFRMEPVGIWITGSAGCGKSSFSTQLLLQIRESLLERGVSIKDNGIFSQPTGSDHMDGYTGQWIHFIDDLAQNRDEDDVKFICQMISSIPFTVPMADLSDKGAQYTSELVIATTNRSDFSSTVIWDSDAFARRFGFKWHLKVNSNYADDDGRLDMAKAMKMSAHESGDAWHIASGIGGNLTYRPCIMKNLVKLIVDDYVKRLHTYNLMKQQVAPLKGIKNRPKQEVINWERITDCLKKGTIKSEGECDDAALLSLTDDEDGEALENFKAILESTAPDSPFSYAKETNMERRASPLRRAGAAITEWVKQKLDIMKEWWKKNKAWFIGIATVAGVVSTSVTAYGLYEYARYYTMTKAPVDYFKQRWLTPTPNDEERPYTGAAHLLKKGASLKKARVVAQGLGANPGEFAHLYRCAVNLWIDGTNCYAIAVGPHRVVTFKHAFTKSDYVVDQVQWSGLTYQPGPDDYTITLVDIEHRGDVLECDYVYIDFHKMPFQMKSAYKYFACPNFGEDGLALIAHPMGSFAQPAENLQPAARYQVDFTSYDRVDECCDGVEYRTMSFKGMCGAMIVQKIAGSWKIVAMHHAGDRKRFGYGFRVRFPDTIGARCIEDEGIVVDKRIAPSPHYTPTKTKLSKSPLYGVVDVKMGPAPLTSRDRRLEIDVPNLTKHAAQKYRVQHYDVDDVVMNQVIWDTKEMLFSATGRCGCWTLEEALDGGGENPIEMATSPGKKYVEKGLTKRDLFHKRPDGTWFVMDEFRQDVNHMLDMITSGQAKTMFCATLKDELRPLEKIKQGKTRCVEACAVDYTVAFRMIFGQLFNKIYASEALQTGLAVGINPYVDYHPLFKAFEGNWFAIDFKSFDGSLSYKLMWEAAGVLCTPLEDYALGMKALDPVLVSEHWVHDEIWTVDGGMPSGSPCTTVLNSLCNLLVVKYAMLKSGHTDLLTLRVVTYGDDVIGSTPCEVDSSTVIATIKESFGMEATPPDKGEGSIFTDFWDATFLKRHFRRFPGTGFITGVLELDSMLQKIMWCHGLNEFKQQLDSFIIELCLHGAATYNEVKENFTPYLDKYNILMPDFETARARAYQLFFAQ